jgi:myo-inositol-1(or 4)-monophosphatase
MIELSAINVAVEAAGHLLLARKRRADQVQAVFTGESATPADVASERLIRSLFARDLPSVPIFAEELGGEARRTGKLLVIDPIDGTGNYLIRDSFWGVSVALVLDGETQIGVIHLPQLRMRFFADRAFAISTRQCVTRTNRLKGAHIWFDANWTRDNPERAKDVLARLTRAGALPQIRRCCTASMMWVASGRIDAFIHTEPKPFDIAAAGLIVEMAGGRTTEVDGHPWGPFSSSIVATNSIIHDELLHTLND